MRRSVMFSLSAVFTVALSGSGNAQWAPGQQHQTEPPVWLGKPDTPTSNCGNPNELRFVRNKDRIDVSDLVQRTTLVCYTFSARKDQHLDVTLLDATPNVVFSILRPGWRYDKNQVFVDGKGLPGLGMGSEKQAAHVGLPIDGRYIIVISISRGAAGSYTMQVRIR